MTNALVYGSRAGVGGLGLQVATAAAGLALAGPVVALGPGRAAVWPLDPPLKGVTWEECPPARQTWFAREVAARLRPGRITFARDRAVGHWAASRLEAVRPNWVYTFTQVGLESLEWAKARGVPIVLDNPNGHIRDFARAYRDEAAKLGRRHHGHPTDEMIARIEREYELADRIRVSSNWAKQSMVTHGVTANKIAVVPQPIDLPRFRPPENKRPAEGPLRVVYVGSLDLRKGFAYLLRAARAVGPGRVAVELVGGTGDRLSKSLLARERAGLDVTVAPGDPVSAYHRAELFVLPSLEDGFGFVTAEAMACGLPAAVSNRCGSAEWVRPGETGWVVPAGDAASLAEVFEQALANRLALAEMGAAARAAVEARPDALRLLADWVMDLCES